MTEVNATDAARNFADLLDAVEHRHEHFTVVRRGRAVAHLTPVKVGIGADVKTVLRRGPVDPQWAADLDGVRKLLEVEERL